MLAKFSIILPKFVEFLKVIISRQLKYLYDVAKTLFFNTKVNLFSLAHIDNQQICL